MSASPGSQRSGNATAKLISLIANGDEAAFRLFYDATNGLLFGLLLRILGHSQTAEGVLSELYQEVRQNAARFGKQNEGPLTWLILMAHRRAIERLCRGLNKKNEISREISARSKSTMAAGLPVNITDQRRFIRAAMESIPNSQRVMIELALFSGLNRVEIALEMGESPEAVEDSLRFAVLRIFGTFRSIGFSKNAATETPRKRLTPRSEAPSLPGDVC